jgi:hypothetical protein
MAGNRKQIETHGCIVCGRLHEMLVLYARDGRMIDCTVTGPGGLRVPDPDRPLAACDHHPQAAVEAAYARWRAALSQEEPDPDG